MSLHRVFFDATVWISAIHKPDGFNAGLLNIASHKAFVTLCSPGVSEEITRWITKHRKPEKQLELSGRHVSLIQTIRPGQVQIAPDDLAKWQDVPESDRHVVAAAVNGKADIIVTGNMRHINKPSVREFVEHVMNPLQFLVWFKKTLG